jgi:hypothetical protein
METTTSIQDIRKVYSFGFCSKPRSWIEILGSSHFISNLQLAFRKAAGVKPGAK